MENPASIPILISEDQSVPIDPTISLPVFEASPLAARCARHLTAEWTEFTLKNVPLHGENFILTWRFKHHELHLLELFLQQPTDGTSWSDWSEEKEKNRKLIAESWIAKVFAATPIVKPFILDGVPITPFEITWDTPRHLLFPWGELTSFYDSKAAFSSLAIKPQK